MDTLPTPAPAAAPDGAAGTPGLDALVEERLARLDLATKVRLLQGETNWRVFAAPDAGLRQVVTSDGPVGVRGEAWDERDIGLNLPSPTALAATWDEDLVERLGLLLAGESRRKGVDVLLAPTVNLHRSPLGGRHFECFSEDPLLTARVGSAFVRGVQAGGVAATVKHYVANDSETDRMTVDVRMDERTLREVYLAPFEHIVAAARPWAVMASYNKVDGVTLTESDLLAEPLKGEWGFDGLVMSDWTAVRSTAESARAALDLAMPGPTGPWGDALLAAVQAGEVPQDAIDEKVRRILVLAARVGALDGVAPAVPPADPALLPLPDAPAVRAAARAAAAQGMVLVRNEGLLPLDGPALARVAVIGPNAAQARTQGGGSATVYPPHTVAPLDGLRAALGDGVEVVHAPGVRTRDVVAYAEPALVRDPVSGEPGVRVTYVGADGADLASEHRRFGRIGWGDPGLEHDAATARIEALLTPEVAGAWQVAAGGLGRHRLEVDGAVAVETEVVVPDGGEPDFVHFVTPPQAATTVTLEAGREVRVVLHVDPLRMNGALCVAELCVEPPVPDPVAGLEEAAALAASSDVAVVVVGTTAAVESEGFDRTSLDLPGAQDELVRRVVAANPRTVVVVNAGAPVLLPWRDEVPAVLLGWFGGQEFGDALADVLLGRREPGGRLPTTWPVAQEDCPVLSTTPVDGVLEYSEGLLLGYRAWAHQGSDGGPAPAYWFGHGLGYTTWEHTGVQVVTPDAEGPSTYLRARVQVRNSGARSGRTVVQAYLSRPDSAVARPPLWLAGFAAVEAGPGEEVEVDVVLAPRAFEHWDAATHRWVVEPGDFVLSVGPSSADRPLTAAVPVTG
ncbi:beta-glucosidase [Kineosporia sp. R_H_3]|uniref:beta-glucosidase family protein n=1 Tax=Kineosporia sp. R_H_3 TaxID=1961848 RepID=UPI001E5D1699|nr:glycoside hydrolase family 3 C-terminal domain-containing protein [Kineosporia sp. R_H_3]